MIIIPLLEWVKECPGPGEFASLLRILEGKCGSSNQLPNLHSVSQSTPENNNIINHDENRNNCHLLSSYVLNYLNPGGKPRLRERETETETEKDRENK